MTSLSDMRTAARADALPEGECGRWRIERKVVEDDHLGKLRASIGGGMGRYTPVGTYTGLLRGRTLVMSDVPDELRDLCEIFHRGRGRILVNGLGLGCVVRGLLVSEDVEHIDVVERSEEILTLVGSSFKSEPRVTIHHADAYEIKWPRGTRWDCAWHDLWDEICADNLPDITRLKRRYGRRTDWQGAWCEELIRR